MAFTVPVEPGYYWAKLLTPRNEPEGEDWKSVAPEVVEVFDNFGDDDERLMASVPGIDRGQPLDAFVWLSKRLLPPAETEFDDLADRAEDDYLRR